MFNLKTTNIEIGFYEFKQLLEHIPYMAYWKDAVNQSYLACNTKFADFIGLENPDQIIGLTGHDIAPTEFVDIVRKNEILAINSKKNTVFKEEIYHPLTGKTTINITIVIPK